jgi:hypothetical protein
MGGGEKLLGGKIPRLFKSITHDPEHQSGTQTSRSILHIKKSPHPSRDLAT